MITNRHRGLVRIHGAVVLLGVAVFFWTYAEITIRWLSDWMKLTREVNLPLYFLCVVVGMLAASGRIRAVESRLTRLPAGDAAGLATTQVALMALTVFTMMFATQDRSISRLFLGTFLVWCWLGLFWSHRVLPRRLAGLLYGQGERIPTLFIGRPESLPLLQEWMSQRMQLGINPAGFVSLEASKAKPETGNLTEQERRWRSKPEDEKLETGNLKPERLGENSGFRSQPLGLASDPQVSGLIPQVSPLSELPRLLAERSIGQVILLELPDSPQVGRQIIAGCQARGCRLLVHHQVEETLGHPVVSVDEGGHHFFSLHDEPLEEPLNRAVKRLFDIAVALPVVGLVLPPLMLVVWLFQRLQSPGPLFHARPRSGERREAFAMLKFRSMHAAPPDDRNEGRQAREDDARIYAFGRFLRRHSLDEFPQFWNVLTGDMSIVGPRPVMPLLDEEFERQVRAYRSKHWVKPGITGLAQSEGWRGEIRTPEQLQERIRLDLHYIAHWSLGLDVMITLKTLRQVFVPPRSAY